MKKLYRSNNNKVISGVCYGLADYFDLDPTLIRIIWAFSSIVSIAIGVVVYIVCAVIIPINPDSTANKETKKVSLKKENVKTKKSIKASISNVHFAFFLIIIGFLLLLDNYIDLDFNLLFPIGLIALGFTLFLKDRDTNEY